MRSPLPTMLLAMHLTLAATSASALAQDDVAQRDALWARVSAKPYAALPKLGSAGFPNTWSGTRGALDKGLMRKAFDQGADVREKRSKVFHPFGAAVKVRFEASGSEGMAGELRGAQRAPKPAHGYTGLFESGGVGIVRLSLANDDKGYIPGVALKLFVKGRPSVNLLGIPSFASQKSSDFFARSPTNVLPGTSDLGWTERPLVGFFIWLQKRAVPSPLVLPLSAVAAADRQGTPAASPRAPWQIFFRPAGAHLPADSKEDFRVLLARHVPAGTVLYTLHAKEQGSDAEVPLGRLVTESPFVASEFADRELHFVHTEHRPAPPPPTKHWWQR